MPDEGRLYHYIEIIEVNAERLTEQSNILKFFSMLESLIDY